MNRRVTAATPGADIVDPARKRRLPFTAIDEAVHLLDTPAEPWGIQLEVGLEGRLDENRLRSAVQHALSVHPMALARQFPAHRTDRTWQWEIADTPDVDPLQVVAWADDNALSSIRAHFYSVPVPLVESPPLRLRLARGPQHDLLMLNANHAAFDGFGALRLLVSVARAYTSTEDPPPPVELDAARDVLALLAAGSRTVRVRRLRALAEKATDLIRPPTPAAPDEGRDLPGYGFFHVVLDETATTAITASATDASVNDVLVAALHLSVDAWNDAHGRSSGRIGVLVPVNLRPEQWREDIVTNMVLDARVATGPSERTTPASTLAAVVAKSERIKAGGGAALIEVLGRLSRLPLWAKEPLSPLLWLTGNRLVDSAILSNLGELADPPSFGDNAGATREIWFSAPCRMPCAVSIGATSVARRLHLAFRYRHRAFSADSIHRFAELFVSQLARTAGETTR